MEIVYSTHIYLICVVCVHISWYYNYPYHILVHIEAAGINRLTKERLAESVQKACDRKDMADEVYGSMKEKARCLTEFLAPGVRIGEDEMVQIVSEIEEFKNSMEVAEREMKASSLAFMTAHATTLEVLGEAGKIEFKKRFCRKSSGRIRCMFCKEEFCGVEVCRQHIIDDHWELFQDTVSICYTC